MIAYCEVTDVTEGAESAGAADMDVDCCVVVAWEIGVLVPVITDESADVAVFDAAYAIILYD